MKKLIPLFTFTFALHLAATAAVPLTWTVETTRAQPAQFEAYQGETLDFEAALTSRGKPLEAPLNYSFFWQTNGMGSAYWEAPANGEAASSPLVRTNVLFATWLPSYDVGAKVYNCFIGSPSNTYHAAFQLRLRPSPGATPNALPLPTPVIDFAKVRVLNPPWSGGGGGVVDTNAVRDIVREQLATNGIRAVDGAARPLPKYLHLYEADDSYPDSAAEYYRQRGSGVPAASCSSVRSGGFLYRNFDYPFDDRAEFVVKMSAGPNRFASVGVSQVGTNLTEQMVTSGKPSRWYKALPGATVDGINEHGVACNNNVVDGEPQWGGGVSPALHPLAAVRWILDNATNAQHAAEYIATHIAFPPGWRQNFHYMIADERETYIVENGTAYPVGAGASRPRVALTNFRLYPTRDTTGEGQERYDLLADGANITNVWYTNAYRRETNPPWVSDLADVLAYTNEIFDAWAEHPKEYFRGKTNNGIPWWQTVHTSIYDLTNRTLRVAVQEQDDWYVFQVPSSGAKVDAYTKAETDRLLDGKANKSGSLDENFYANLFGFREASGGRISTAFVQIEEDVTIGNPQSPAHRLSLKANRPVDWDPTHAGNIATLDANGNLADGGIATNDVATKFFVVDYGDHEYLSKYGPDEFTGDLVLNGGDFGFGGPNGGPLYQSLLYTDVNRTDPGPSIFVSGSMFYKGPPTPDFEIAVKGDIPAISATDQTFSNEVATVARTVTPQPSQSLRLFDPVLNRWVILKSVNMNITLEVE